MSTRLTKKGVPMVESQSLKLVFGAAAVNENISRYLSVSLKAKGYESVTPSVLNFLSALECGENYGSDIARNLNVSRQMVAKTVKSLCQVGYLEQLEATGKQKRIIFTKVGEQLMSDSRQLLADLDVILYEAIGQSTLQESIATLHKIQHIIDELNA